jgi:hypothetical protein
LFYEIVKHDSSYWISSNIIFEMNALGKIIHYIPKHSLKFGFASNHKFIETIAYAGVRYMTIFTVLEVLIFPRWKSTPQYIVQILNNKDKTYLCLFLMGCMSIRTINFDLI